MTSHLSVRRIAIAVRSVDQSKQLFEALFAAKFEDPPEGTVEGVRCLVWRREGSPGVELVQAVDEDGYIARFIRKRGEGIHHLSVTVPDLGLVAERLAEEGARLVRTPSYYRRPDGSAIREVFIHPKDAGGVLLHVMEEA